MKRYIVPAIALIILFSCNNKPKPVPAPVATETPSKGEFAFLLKYNGEMPSDVGFLTNHVVERRLASILKDSFQVFMRLTKYDRPIVVDGQQVAALFYSDSDRTMPSAVVSIDVANDAIWAEYLSGDSTILYTDHPSLEPPGIF
jgi:hypothetical protein